nr:TPA_asm: G [Lycium betacytorhabdovirus 1]
MFSKDQLIILSLSTVYLLLILIKVNAPSCFLLSKFEKELALDSFREMFEEWIFEISKKYNELLREQVIEYIIFVFMILMVAIFIFRLSNCIIKHINKAIIKITILCLCFVFRIPQSIISVVGFLYSVLKRITNINQLDTYRIRLSSTGLSDSDVLNDDYDNTDNSYQTYFSLNNMRDMVFLDDNMNVCVPITHQGKTYYKITKTHHIV